MPHHKGVPVVLWFFMILAFQMERADGLSSPSWLLSLPQTPWPSIRSYNPREEEYFRHIVRKEMKKLYDETASDGESVDALEHFFWGMRGGIVLEMGGLDGNISSQSRIFEKVGWKRIIVEGNPQFREALTRLPTAVTVAAAVCKEKNKGIRQTEVKLSERTVHFIADNTDNFTSGILEHMTTKFVKRRFHPIYAAGGAQTKQTSKHFNTSVVNWQHPMLHTKKAQNMFSISEVHCVDLQEVLATIQVSHVNLLILDVEGAERSVLQSIDFQKTTFDVLVIERQSPNELLKFMNSLPDYELVYAKGRNLWYKRVAFTPSLRRTVNKKCFRGRLAARGNYRCAHSRMECAAPTEH